MAKKKTQLNIRVMTRRQILAEIRKNRRALAKSQPVEIRQKFMDLLKIGTSFDEARAQSGLDEITASGTLEMQIRTVKVIDWEVKK